MLTYKSVEQVHWLRAKAQFERWLEEQDSIHNEAQWIPAYFHAKANTWKNLMVTSVTVRGLAQHSPLLLSFSHGSSYPMISLISVVVS
jgi:hypothetical protein